MFGSLTYGLRRAAQRAGYSLAGLVLVTIGTGFLTAALWMFLSELRDALFAATVIGALYVGVGLILLALSRRCRPVPMAHPVGAPPPPAASAAGLFAALMQGIGAGMAAGAARRGPPPSE